MFIREVKVWRDLYCSWPGEVQMTSYVILWKGFCGNWKLFPKTIKILTIALILLCYISRRGPDFITIWSLMKIHLDCVPCSKRFPMGPTTYCVLCGPSMMFTLLRDEKVCKLMSVGLWSFYLGYSKLVRFLHKNQHTQRKFWYFVNRNNVELPKIGHIFTK